MNEIKMKLNAMEWKLYGKVHIGEGKSIMGSTIYLFFYYFHFILLFCADNCQSSRNIYLK